VLRDALVVVIGRKRARRVKGGVGGRYVAVRIKENGDSTIATTPPFALHACLDELGDPVSFGCRSLCHISVVLFTQGS
jgi:hypothetical protein